MSDMNRRQFLKAVGVGAAALSVGRLPALAASAPAAQGERPNIILAMTDDQGWGDVSYNGCKQIETPSLDTMAKEGMRFNRFYSAHPSCSPTRASVMTGRHPNRMGCFWPGMALRNQEMTVAQAVKRAGYATGHFGKWHLNGVSGPGKPIAATDPHGPGKFGFDEWFSVSNYFETDWTFSHNGTNVKVSGDGSDAIVAQALKFIADSAGQKKPFLALVWFGSPHVPHKPMPDDLKKGGGIGYYGELAGVDRAMGTLRSGLRKLGIADNTLLWFCSDNGAWHNAQNPTEHGSNGGLHGMKGQVWEGGIRVPGLIEWPARITKPVVTEVPATTSDIYPTIVDILKVKVPNQIEPLDGISLVPLLDGKMKERPKPMGFWSFDDTVDGGIAADSGPSAWINGRYKLHKGGQGRKSEKPARRRAGIEPGTWELYDLIADPNETTDIATKNPEIVARMKAELESWLASVLKSNRGEDYPEGKVIPSPKIILNPQGAGSPTAK
jgi:arylsulfatase A-like enzyme